MVAETFTELFHRGRQGDSIALGLAYTLVFGQLHRTAQRLLNGERQSPTLQPTALVSELFLRFHSLGCRVLSREHFLHLAARSMKQLLVDRGRGRVVRRRLEPEVRMTVTLALEPQSPAQIAARHVWERLRSIDAGAAEAIWLLKVEGLTIKEVAVRQRRPAWRVVADSEFALDWMAKRLT